jgi:hypothetical protein
MAIDAKNLEAIGGLLNPEQRLDVKAVCHNKKFAHGTLQIKDFEDL